LKVLVVGCGRARARDRPRAGRSPQRPEVLCAPGNPGIARDARCSTSASRTWPRWRAAAREAVDLVVVGPRRRSSTGSSTRCRAAIAAFGPTREVAQLEGSKAFAKEVMEAAGVATATWRR
jgi:phosphoribosylamine--glycine ligase